MRTILWTISVMVLTLIFLVFLVSSIFGTVGAAIEINSIMNGEQVAGIINALQTAPVGTGDIYFLPKGSCSLKIDTFDDLTMVNFTETAAGKTYIGPLIITDTEIENAEILCDGSAEKRVYLLKCQYIVKISTAGGMACA